MYQYGVDVAAQRADDLDRAALERTKTLFQATNTPVPVLDLGAGSGGHAMRLAAAGAAVSAVDFYPTPYTTLVPPAGTVRFINADMRVFLSTVSSPVSIAMMQRVLHYVPYDHARVILQDLRTCVADTLFISVTGIESAIGAEYGGKTVSLKNRFHYLTPSDQSVFQITAPVCLYTHKEFQQLLVECGWVIEDIWLSAFGNSKAIARPQQ